MNYRQIILSTLKGEHTGILPFIPRLDLWYKANRQNGTLPREYRDATLTDITDDLDIGFHAVIPDFRDFSDETDDVDQGLGIFRFKTLPYSMELHNIERKFSRENGMVTTEYMTPYGKVRTRVLFDDTMKKSGATLPHIVEHAVKGVDDFRAAAYIFENAEVKPRYENYAAFSSHIGDRGVAVAFNSTSASPMHLILKELMPLDTFFYEYHDHPDEMHEFADRISAYYDRVFSVTADSPADVVMSGGNYDSSITSPPFFEKHIMPYLQKQSGILHSKGKYLLTHTDGENRGLLGLFVNSRFDIADSICPAPMTGYTLEEFRRAFGGKITIWGGIPSVSVLENTMNDYEFEKYLDMTLESIGNGDHIIFSIADTTPPGAKFDRIRKLARRIREFAMEK